MSRAKCKIKIALISVFDKTGLLEFAEGLVSLGVKIVSTGGTYKALTEAGVPVIYVAEKLDSPKFSTAG